MATGLQQRANTERYLDLAEVISVTYYSLSTVRRAIYNREMAVSRRGPRGRIRVRESEVHRWMRAHETPARRLA